MPACSFLIKKSQRKLSVDSQSSNVTPFMTIWKSVAVQYDKGRHQVRESALRYAPSRRQKSAVMHRWKHAVRQVLHSKIQTNDTAVSS